MICVVQLTPTTPMPLFPTAPIVPDDVRPMTVVVGRVARPQ